MTCIDLSEYGEQHTVVMTSNIVQKMDCTLYRHNVAAIDGYSESKNHMDDETV